MAYILALDQGTTGSTALLIDDELSLVAKANCEFPQHFPQPGWVEHDLDEIWQSMLKAIAKVLEQSRVKGRDIAAIGITNQRETVGFFARGSGAKLAPAIVWQCRRTAARCAALEKDGYTDRIYQKTGLVLDAYFSGTKAEWLLEHVPGLRRQAEAGDALLGTIDSFLIYRLTGGAAHVTDVSNASRTMLFDIDRLGWDDQLCQLFSVPKACLPRVVGCAEQVGVTRGVPGLPDGVPVSGIAGDQQAALFGQACFEPGMAKCTYGTGSFMLQNTGTKRVKSDARLITTVAWKVGDTVHYALEGSVFIAGALVQWLRDGLGIIKDSTEVQKLAMTVADSAGVTIVPAFAGLGAPYWRADARGSMSGLTRGTTRAHIARAAEEAIALQNYEVLAAMRRDTGTMTLLRVDGGAAGDDLLMQFQSDILRLPLSRPRVVETTGFGAACLAALGVKMFTDLSAMSRVWKEERRFTPTMADAEVEQHLQRWRTAVAKA